MTIKKEISFFRWVIFCLRFFCLFIMLAILASMADRPALEQQIIIASGAIMLVISITSFYFKRNRKLGTKEKVVFFTRGKTITFYKRKARW